VNPRKELKDIYRGGGHKEKNPRVMGDPEPTTKTSWPRKVAKVISLNPSWERGRKKEKEGTAEARENWRPYLPSSNPAIRLGEEDLVGRVGQSTPQNNGRRKAETQKMRGT